jgi:hypothetical protein
MYFPSEVADLKSRTKFRGKVSAIEFSAAIATGGLKIIARNLQRRFLSDPDSCGTAPKVYRKAVESTLAQQKKQRS